MLPQKIKPKGVDSIYIRCIWKKSSVPFSEDSDLIIGRPEVKRWSYAISKMFEEQLVFAYHERYGINAVALRFLAGMDLTNT